MSKSKNIAIYIYIYSLRNLVNIGTVFILFLSLQFFNNNSIAQCPIGHINATYDLTIGSPPNQCRIKVLYCYKCGPGSATPSSLIINNIYFYPSNSSCNAFIPGMLDFVIGKTVENYYSKCTIPPCTTGTTIRNLEVKMSQCAKLNNNWYTFYGDEELPPFSGYLLDLEFCNEQAQCVYEYEICNDYINGNPYTRKTLLGKYKIGTATCSTTVPLIPPPGKTWEEEWITDCFIFGCEN